MKMLDPQPYTNRSQSLSHNFSASDDSKCLPLDTLLNDIKLEREKSLEFKIDGFQKDSLHLRNYFWVHSFNDNFINPRNDSHSQDDLLFYVSKQDSNKKKGTPTVIVYRRNHTKLPDLYTPFIDWEETVYLNLIMHCFSYELTVGVCTRTGPYEVEILKKFSKILYASPSYRRMDVKSSQEEIMYPHIYFTIDNYEELFESCVIHDSESLCVELIAHNISNGFQSTIFLGNVRYSALKKSYDSKKENKFSVKRNASLLFNFRYNSSNSNSNIFTSNNTKRRLQFIKMRGPQGKGHAEIALSAINDLDIKIDAQNRISQEKLFVKSDDFGENKFLNRSRNVSSGNLELSMLSSSNTYLNFKRTALSLRSSPTKEDPYILNQSFENKYEQVQSKSSSRIAALFANIPLNAQNKSSLESTSTLKDFNYSPSKVQSNYNIRKTVSEGEEISTYTHSHLDEDSCSEVLTSKSIQDEFENSEHSVGELAIGGLQQKKSFDHSWYWFKERRRISSVSLNIYLTYICLPWHRIIADMFDVRQESLLNF